MLREAEEETGLLHLELHFKGLKTWSKADRTGFGGLYLYIGFLAEHYSYPTPRRTEEGILEWKDLNWMV
ncbi:MAG: hypothetical protein QM451_06945 [Bacillota bacterium]|jgi:8-oxo-dGTP diphosphatase|nr:hypothetical protein [Bacillota bacterium]HHT91167.1 hypothetical protein [Bacillota bacterium]